jgi:predicted S18 family serine protease
MSEQAQLTPSQALLANVPGIAETRINALLSALTQQRDTASNAASNLAAEIEVYRTAADFYQQQSLGLQAHVAMIKNDYVILVEERDRLQEKTAMMGSDLLAASGERDSHKTALMSLVEYIESATSLKDCRGKVASYISSYLQPALPGAEYNSEDGGKLGPLEGVLPVTKEANVGLPEGTF